MHRHGHSAAAWCRCLRQLACGVFLIKAHAECLHRQFAQYDKALSHSSLCAYASIVCMFCMSEIRKALLPTSILPLCTGNLP